MDDEYIGIIILLDLCESLEISIRKYFEKIKEETLTQGSLVEPEKHKEIKWVLFLSR